MITKRKKSIVVIIGGILIVTGVLFLISGKNRATVFPEAPTLLPRVDSGEENEPPFAIEGGTVPFAVSVADNSQTRAQGLSGTPRLLPQTGKFFIFETPGMYGFWMKDMNFAIDIIWIDEDMKIVGISANRSPDSYPEVFYPPTQVRYVLEVAAGEAEKNNFSLGTQLNLLEK